MWLLRNLVFIIIISCSSTDKEVQAYPQIVGNPWDGYLLNSWNIKDKLLDHSKVLVSASNRKYQFGTKETFDILKAMQA